MLPGRLFARAFALVGVSGVVFAGFATTPATAAGTVGVSPAAEPNTVVRTLTFSTSDTLLPSPAPAPTVTLTRHATAADPTPDTVTPTSVAAIPAGLGSKNLNATFDFTGANPGSYDITVQQVATTDTCSACFTIQAFTPAVSGVSPTTLGLGGSMQPFTVNGQNFAKGPYTQCVSASCSGPSVAIYQTGTTTSDPNATLTQTVTFDSSGTAVPAPTPTTASTIQLRLLLGNSSAAAYDDDVVVTNSDGKASAVCHACLHVAPQPTVTGLTLTGTGAPAIGLNAQHQQIVVSGHDFPLDSVVSITPPAGAPAGSAIHIVQSAPAFVVDHQEITLNDVDTTQANQAGAWKVAVSSPSLHNRSVTSTTASTLTVDAAPTATNLTYDDANSIKQVGQGAQARHISVAGAGIVTGTHINFAGLPAGITPSDDTDDVPGQKVSTVLDLTQNATIGSYTVTLVNPDGGTSSACAVPPANQLASATPCPLVVAAGPSISRISPNTVTGGYTGGVVVTGTNFHTGTHNVFVTIGPSAAPYFSGLATAVAGSGGTQSISIGSINVPASATLGDTDVAVTNVDDGGTKTAAGILHIANLSVIGINPNFALNEGTASVTVTGTDFAPDATVLLRRAGLADINGTNVHVADPTSLTADFNVDGAGPGDYQVLVTNPPTSSHPGTAGNPVFTVTSSDPHVGSVSPTSAGGGATNLAVTVTGTGFYPGRVVSFDGDPDIALVGAAVINSVTSITQHISIAQSAQSGTATVTVTNSAGFASNTANFAVDPAPLVVGVSPSPRAPGTYAMSVGGAGFDPAAELSFSDPGVHAANVVVANDGSSLTADITIDPSVVTSDAPVPVAVTVTNPDHGRATTPAGHELVVDPEPRVTQVTPTSLAAGSSVPLQVLGANFLDGASLTAPSGSGLTVSNVQFVNAGEIDATVDVAADATRGSRTLTLSNNPDGGSVTQNVDVYVVPDPPTGLSVTPDNASLALFWTAPADNGGNAISSYTVHATPSGGGTTVSQTTQSVPTQASPLTVSGLNNGTSYDVSVVATNGAGDSGPVNGAGTPRTVPATPVSFVVTPNNGGLDLAWATPDSGGSPITGYTATVTPHGGASLPAHSLGAAAVSDTFAGLTNGTLYDVLLVASNVAGDSAPATGSGTPRTVPGAPTGLTVTPGDGTLGVSWAAPSSDGGNAISAYTVSLTPDAGGPTTSFTTPNGTTTSHQFTGLSNGTLYDVSVIATNAAGPSSAATASGTPRTTPSAPTGLTVTAGNGTLDVSWTAPSSNGGNAIASYRVSVVPHTGGAPTTFTTPDGTTTAHQFTGLSNGTLYDVSVVATNAAGNSTPPTTSSGTPRTVPGAPTGLIVTPGDGTLGVSWSAPSGDGGNPISAYTVAVTPHGGGTTATSTGSSTSHQFTGLSNGTLYDVSVVASNAAGPSSAATASGTPRTTPSAPTSLIVTPGDSSLAVSWSAPSSDGGNAISAYTVSVTPHAGGSPATSTGAATSHTFTGLTNGTLYDVAVVATNAAGDSPAATAAGSPRVTPAAPTSLTLVAGDAALGVVWAAPATDGGDAVKSYTVSVTPHSGGTTTTFTTPDGATKSHTFSGLTNGTLYDVTVVANNAAGSSPTATGSGTPKFTAALTIHDSASHIIDGAKITLSGVLKRSDGSGVAGAAVTIMRTLDGRSAGRYLTLTTNSTGAWTTTLAPATNATYRAVFAGSGSVVRASSGNARTTVAPKVTIRSPLNKSTSSSATALKITGRVGPNKAGRVVVLYYVTKTGKLVKITSTRLTTKSTYVLNARLKRGTWHLRILIGASPGNTRGSSSTLTVKRT